MPMYGGLVIECVLPRIWLTRQHTLHTLKKKHVELRRVTSPVYGIQKLIFNYISSLFHCYFAFLFNLNSLLFLLFLSMLYFLCLSYSIVCRAYSNYFAFPIYTFNMCLLFIGPTPSFLYFPSINLLVYICPIYPFMRLPSILLFL